MRRISRLNVVLCFPFIAAGTLATARNVSPAVTTDCVLTIDDPIPVTADPVKVTAKFNEPMGDTLTGSIDRNSQVEVVSVKREANSDPMSAVMTLNTVRGQVGEWQVSIRGERGMCGGKVWIGKGAKKSK